MTSYEIYRSADFGREEWWSLVVDPHGLLRVQHEWHSDVSGSEEWTVDAFLESDEPKAVKDALLDLLTTLKAFVDGLQ